MAGAGAASSARPESCRVDGFVHQEARDALLAVLVPLLPLLLLLQLKLQREPCTIVRVVGRGVSFSTI